MSPADFSPVEAVAFYVVVVHVCTAVAVAWLCHTAPVREDLARIDRELDESAADERAEWEAAEADRHYEMGRER